MWWLLALVVLALILAVVIWRRQSRVALGAAVLKLPLEAVFLQDMMSKKKAKKFMSCNCVPARAECSAPSFYTQSYPTKRGLVMQSSGAVSMDTLKTAGDFLDAMISPKLEQALKPYNGLRVSVIAQGEEVSDLPEYCWLKNACTFDGRCYNTLRGIGSIRADLPGVVAEENVMCLRSDPYAQESITLHEFGHTLMDVVIREQLPDLHSRIMAAYDNAINSGAVPRGIYMSANANEYWAEAVQAYFGASIRSDTNAGINTRQALQQRDPQGYAVVHEAFDGAPGVHCGWSSTDHWCCGPN